MCSATVLPATPSSRSIEGNLRERLGVMQCTIDSFFPLFLSLPVLLRR